MSTTNSTTHTAHCATGACPICNEENGNIIIVDNAYSATNIECSQVYDPFQESEFEKWNRLKSQKNFRKMMKKGKL